MSTPISVTVKSQVLLVNRSLQKPQVPGRLPSKYISHGHQSQSIGLWKEHGRRDYEIEIKNGNQNTFG